jgi:hypothetical protein
VKLFRREVEATETIEELNLIRQAIWGYLKALVAMDHRNSSIIIFFINSVNNFFEIQTKRISAGLIDRIPTYLTPTNNLLFYLCALILR